MTGDVQVRIGDHHGRGARHARRAPGGRARAWRRATSSTRPRGCRCGSRERHPRRRDDAPGDRAARSTTAEREPVEAKGKAGRCRSGRPSRARARVGVDAARDGSTARRARARARRPARRARPGARRARAAARDGRGRPGDRQVAARLRAPRPGVERDPDLITGVRAARSRTGRASRSGRSARWSRPRRASSRATRADAPGKLRGRSSRRPAATPLGGTHLRPLVGLGEDEATPRRTRGVVRRLAAFLEALAEARPLVLVFEDLHWADDGLLDFVDHLADWATGVPLLVVCTARPELLERRPGWGGGKPNAVDALAVAVVGRGDAPPRARLLARGRAARGGPAGAASHDRRQPALRRAVRASGHASEATPTSCRSPRTSRG